MQKREIVLLFIKRTGDILLYAKIQQCNNLIVLIVQNKLMRNR